MNTHPNLIKRFIAAKLTQYNRFNIAVILKASFNLSALADFIRGYISTMTKKHEKS